MTSRTRSPRGGQVTEEVEQQEGRQVAEREARRQAAEEERQAPRHLTLTAEEALRNTYAWFEVNSGWAQPDDDNLAEWIADGVCRCPDECIVAPDSWCEHGLASWWLIVQDLPDYSDK